MIEVVEAYTPYSQRAARAEAKASNQNNAEFPKGFINKAGEFFHTKPELKSNEFNLISFNTLGPLHGESSKHAYAPQKITRWTRRRDKIVTEIRQTSPDFLCLQEVSQVSVCM